VDQVVWSSRCQINREPLIVIVFCQWSGELTICFYWWKHVFI